MNNPNLTLHYRPYRLRRMFVPDLRYEWNLIMEDDEDRLDARCTRLSRTEYPNGVPCKKRKDGCTCGMCFYRFETHTDCPGAFASTLRRQCLESGNMGMLEAYYRLPTVLQNQIMILVSTDPTLAQHLCFTQEDHRRLLAVKFG